MMSLQCPKCGRIQQIDMTLYLEIKNLKDSRKQFHPFTCTCGDHIEMVTCPLSDEEYQKRKLQLLESYAPPVYTCKTCGSPVLYGYICRFCGEENPGCDTYKEKAALKEA